MDRSQQGLAGKIAETVLRCPTGALHFKRLDTDSGEAVPKSTSVRIGADEPLYRQENLALSLPDGSTLRETRAALCWCDASRNKPFCDNTTWRPSSPILEMSRWDESERGSGSSRKES